MANPQKNGKKKSDEKESGSYGAKWVTANLLPLKWMKHVILQYMVNPQKKWKQVIRRKGIW
jgi:hypothetical protein